MSGAGWAALGLAVVCAALMGFAVQRGATCAIAAVGELVNERKANRLLALAEAAVWVAGMLLVARAFGLLATEPMSFAITGWTIVGGALLGIGALVNGACVFGAIARIGSRDWSYLMTPVGFFLGCLTVGPLFAAMVPPPEPTSSPIFAQSQWLLWPFLAFAAWRIWQGVGALRSGSFGAHVWSPHRATAVIGITFAIMLLAVGAWSYTNALADLAAGRTDGLTMRLVLLVALFAGALVGGMHLASQAPSASRMLQCLVGGMLMGWGGALVPGSNDGLILIGLPFLLPFAWLALAVMCLSIALGLLAKGALRRRVPA